MQFRQAFPIAIIDEDFEGKHAAGLGMRQLAAAIEKEGFRVVAGVSYEDARRLVHIFNSEVLLADLSGWNGSQAVTVASPGGSSNRKTPEERQTANFPFW